MHLIYTEWSEKLSVSTGTPTGQVSVLSRSEYFPIVFYVVNLTCDLTFKPLLTRSVVGVLA